MLVRIATSVFVFVTCILSTILSSDCSADFTEERAVSLEWLTDSSQAIVVVEPVKGGKYNHGWPMRVVRILKADKRIAMGHAYTIDERVNRHSPKPRLVVFFRADQNGKLRVHETCGRDMLRYYHASKGVTLLGFDRDGHFVQSIDHAISIILQRVKRGTNTPQPNYAQVENLRGPIKGGFYRQAEDDFDDFFYMVLVPADPDFRPMIELQTGLPIGYIPPGTLDKNYGSKQGPITKRPLDGEGAVSTLAAVLRNITADGSARGGLIHSRRGLEIDYNRPEEEYRQSYELSPCGDKKRGRKGFFSEPTSSGQMSFQLVRSTNVGSTITTSSCRTCEFALFAPEIAYVPFSSPRQVFLPPSYY